jgi:hypothetical protein
MHTILFERETADLVRRVNRLREPYRENTIAWLQSYTRKPINDLHTDISDFLRKLNPVACEYFLHHTGLILRDAERYFCSHD